LNSSIEPKLQALKEYSRAKKSIDKESIKLNKKLNELESTRNSLDKTIEEKKVINKKKKKKKKK